MGSDAGGNGYGMGGGYGSGLRHVRYGSSSGRNGNGIGGEYGSSVGAKKIQRGTLCSATGSKEITSENECKAAAKELGLVWAGSWNGPNDFPGCLYAEDGRNKVYFNTSPNPRRTNLNPNYAAICEARREWVAKKIQRGTLCSATGSKEITSANECKAAAEELGLVWATSWNGPNDFPGCLYAEDGRNKVYFNTSPNPRRTNLNPNYAAICEAPKRNHHGKQGVQTARFFGCKEQKIALQVPSARVDDVFIKALPDQWRVNANGASNERGTQFIVHDLGQSPTKRDARMIALESIYGKYVTAVRPSNDTNFPYPNANVTAASTFIYYGDEFEVKHNNRNQYWFKTAFKSPQGHSQYLIGRTDGTLRGNGTVGELRKWAKFTPHCVDGRLYGQVGGSNLRLNEDLSLKDCCKNVCRSVAGGNIRFDVCQRACSATIESPAPFGNGCDALCNRLHGFVSNNCKLPCETAYQSC